MHRHALGVLGVLAAGVLLAVSAAMNWRFGYTLGRTEFDGQIYGAASAAADCLKALVPFFLFAAIRNRMWSQAIASALVWTVVTAYSLTSALGHAALNRMETGGQRVIEAQVYKDLRQDLERAKSQLAWVPQHRPIATVQAELDGLKTQRRWEMTKSCTDATTSKSRDYCQQVHALGSELASAQKAAKLEARIASVQAKLANVDAGSVNAPADPQAKVLADLSGMSIEHMQIALVVFIALLLEIGSGLGMYIAFSQWRLYDRHAPAAPAMATLAPQVVPALPVQAPATKPRVSANDNKTVTPAATKLVAPENDVERFYKERIETQDGSSLTATELYEDYCEWCEVQGKEPLALPSFGRGFGELGVRKERIAGRIRYIGVAIKSGNGTTEAKNSTAFRSKAA
ncbi:MAG: hypothetical protein RLZ98_3073 [Pseudomonadota bacterium]|jgi:hypothetical protein